MTVVATNQPLPCHNSSASCDPVRTPARATSAASTAFQLAA